MVISKGKTRDSDRADRRPIAPDPACPDVSPMGRDGREVIAQQRPLEQVGLSGLSRR